ncbi:hypothetical protein HaLaN_02420 [Haematococcus lacustris]|uniref:Uncharacterized protein n=1 Tax=Haematococcus lacustris TaxID=44745 RepID=A0A699YL03_HAELA|nr:hypothetical protein HaLaN_02420 [Haematococcus lacustris]
MWRDPNTKVRIPCVTKTAQHERRASKRFSKVKAQLHAKETRKIFAFAVIMLLAADSQCLDDLFMRGWAVPREVPRAQEAERLVSELKQELQGQNACIAQLQHSSESTNESNSLLAAELELQLQAKAQLMRDKARLQQENMLLWSERQLLAEQLGLHPADCSESNSLCQALSEQMQAAKRGQLAVKQLEGVIAYLHEALVLGEGQHTDWQVRCVACVRLRVLAAA